MLNWSYIVSSIPALCYVYSVLLYMMKLSLGRHLIINKTIHKCPNHYFNLATSFFFIEMPVPPQEIEWSCFCPFLRFFCILFWSCSVVLYIMCDFDNLLWYFYFYVKSKKKHRRKNTLLVLFHYTKRSNHDVYEWAFRLL